MYFFSGKCLGFCRSVVRGPAPFVIERLIFGYLSRGRGMRFGVKFKFVCKRCGVYDNTDEAKDPSWTKEEAL